MHFIRSLIALILTAIIAIFAVMNREDASVMWSPFHDVIILPLYAVILGSLLSGFLMGGFAVWINDSGLRKTRRQQKKKIKGLEKELTQAQTLQTYDALPSDFFPALPPKSPYADNP